MKKNVNKLTLQAILAEEVRVRYEFQRTLPIELKAILQIQDEEIRLKSLTELWLKYGQLSFYWYKLFGMNTGDPGKIFTPTELIKHRGSDYFLKQRKVIREGLCRIEEEKTILEIKKKITDIHKEESEINPEYRKFWEQLLKTNPKTGIPYMNEKSLKIFVASSVNRTPP